ncbi:MAG: FitA-like ribbon-helix-helix domain-containing protein [Candidatus Dormibacteria bacterium]
MATLYLRNVPDDVLARLQRLAARDGASVSATAVRELAEATRRADNPALLGNLPDLEVDAAEIVSSIESARGSR